MEIRANQLVLAKVPGIETSVLAWVKSLTTSPGSVSVLCTTLVEEKLLSFESELEHLEVIIGSRETSDADADIQYLLASESWGPAQTNSP